MIGNMLFPYMRRPMTVGESTDWPPFKESLLFFSDSRKGPSVIDKVKRGNPNAIVDPTIDIIDLSKYTYTVVDGWNTVTFKTIEEDKVYRVISNKTELANINTNTTTLGYSYIMDSNITFADSDFEIGGIFYKSGEGWNPIGDNVNKFTGVFNGNGFEIKNIYIDKPSSDYIGLFGMTENAEISNISVTDFNITGNKFVGGLAGVLSSSTTKSIFSSGTARSTIINDGRCGGFAGQASNGEIYNCVSMSNVIGDKYIGGLIGANTVSIITNSYSYGSLDCTQCPFSGGLVGYQFIAGVITNSYYRVYDGYVGNTIGTGLTANQMTYPYDEVNAYINWDFETVWNIDPLINDGYPHLQYKVIEGVDGEIVGRKYAQIGSACYLEITKQEYLNSCNNANEIIFSWHVKGRPITTPYLLYSNRVDGLTQIDFIKVNTDGTLSFRGRLDDSSTDRISITSTITLPTTGINLISFKFNRTLRVITISTNNSSESFDLSSTPFTFTFSLLRLGKGYQLSLSAVFNLYGFEVKCDNETILNTYPVSGLSDGIYNTVDGELINVLGETTTFLQQDFTLIPLSAYSGMSIIEGYDGEIPPLESNPLVDCINGDPLTNPAILKIVSNVDGYVIMPETTCVYYSGQVRSVFDKSDTVLYNDNARGDYYDPENPTMWHISEFNITTISDYSNIIVGVDKYVFIMAKSIFDTSFVMKSVKTLFAYPIPVKTSDLFAYILDGAIVDGSKRSNGSFIFSDEWNDDIFWNDNLLWSE